MTLACCAQLAALTAGRQPHELLPPLWAGTFCQGGCSNLWPYLGTAGCAFLGTALRALVRSG